MKLCNSKQETDELKEKRQYHLASLLALEISTQKQLNFMQIIFITNYHLLKDFLLVQPCLDLKVSHQPPFSYRGLLPPSASVASGPFTCSRTFVCLYVTVLLLYKVAVLVVRVSFYLISFEMDVKLYWHTQAAAPCKQAKSKILKMEGKDKLASRQLHSPFCTAYGPPGGFRQ